MQITTERTKVYLSGSVANSPEDFQNWRDIDNGPRYKYMYMLLIDPMKYFDYTYNAPITDKQCMDHFMWLIDQSDVLLVNMDNSKNSVGTGMEVEHAYKNGIPIIGFGKDENTWYPWIKERTSVIFQNREDAVDYIYQYYVKSMMSPLDGRL